MSAIICDFGKNAEGVNLFRINGGTEQEVINAISKLKKAGCEIWEPYEIEKSHGTWSVLLKVHVPIGEKKEQRVEQN